MTIYNIVEKDKRFLVAPPKALFLPLPLFLKQEIEKVKDLEEIRKLFKFT
jgi:hypothetical protein